MNTEHQPEALQLADQLQEMSYGTCHNAAIELRRLVPFEAWYEESVDEINRLRCELDAANLRLANHTSMIKGYQADMERLRAQVEALTAERTVTHRKIAEASEAMSWAMANCDLAGRSYFFERKLEGLRAVLANAPAPAPTRPAVPDEDDSLSICVSDLEHSAIYDNHAEMQNCMRAVAERIKLLAAAPQAETQEGK